MLEKAIRTKIIKRLRDDYPDSYWFVSWGGPSGQQTGLPDIMGCLKGRFVGIEVKRPGKESTLTVRQDATLRAIRRAGGASIMVTSVDQTLDFVKQIIGLTGLIWNDTLASKKTSPRLDGKKGGNRESVPEARTQTHHEKGAHLTMPAKTKKSKGKASDTSDIEDLLDSLEDDDEEVDDDEDLEDEADDEEDDDDDEADDDEDLEDSDDDEEDEDDEDEEEEDDEDDPDEAPARSQRKGGKVAKAKKAKSKKKAADGIGTSDLADHLGMNPRDLRAFLRKRFPQENSGERYHWKSFEDKQVKRIIAAVNKGEAKAVRDEALSELKGKKKAKGKSKKSSPAPKRKKKAKA
jgi:cobalamin biosynthesis protein CobT